MKTKRLFFILLLMVCIPSAGAEEIGLLGGSKAGTYIKIARDIRDVSKGVMDIKVHTGGSLGNINKVLKDRDSQFAIVQYDALLYKKAYLDPKLDKKIKMIFPLYNEEIHLIARKGAHIDSVKDLAGKKVNMDKKESGPWVTATIIRDHLGIEWEEYNYSPVDALENLIIGEIDAWIYTCGQPAPVLSALDEEAFGYIKLVPLELDELFVPATFAAHTYPWQPHKVKTSATKAVLITYNYHKGPGAPKRFAYYVNNISGLIKMIYNNLDYLRAQKHEKWKEINPYDYTKVKWPLHDAAKQVFDGGRAARTGTDRKRAKLVRMLRKNMAVN